MEIYRGDIFNIYKANTATGSEYDGGRPAVVVSNDKCNMFSNCIEVVFLTSQEKKPLPTHVSVLCKVPSTALCESVTTVSKERIGEYIKQCTEEEMNRIEEAMMISLGITKGDAEWDLINKLTETEESLAASYNQIKELEEKLAKAEKSKKSTDDTKYKAEAKIYKEQYERLLDRLLER